VPRPGYRVGVPRPGFYREAVNSDAEAYGGSAFGERKGDAAEPVEWMGRPQSIVVDLPPLAGLILVLDPYPDATEPLKEPDDAQDADAQ
jgi:1,4-alpha-glucan branching enzyme